MIRDYPSIETPNGVYEWAAPIDYGNIVFGQAPGWQDNGTLYRDGSIGENNGTLVNGPMWRWVKELGRWGIDYGTTLKYIQVPDFTYGPRFTVSFWFNWPSSVGTSYDYMFSHGAWNAQNSLNIYHFRQLETGFPRLRTALLDSNDSASQWIDIFTNLAGTGWNHYCISVGGPVANSVVYLNGIQKSTSGQGGDAFNPSTNILIGCRSDLDDTRRYDGLLSEPIIFNIALSPPQIRWLANRDNNPWQPYRRKSWAVTSAVTDPPNTPTDLIATAIAHNRIDVAWTHDGANVNRFELQRCIP